MPISRIDYSKVFAPFNGMQIFSLNRFQTCGFFHPISCPNFPHPSHHHPMLEATPLGMVCRFCAYATDWVWAYMTDPQLPDKFAQSLQNLLESQR